jgi:hypothetical protein
LEDGEGGESSSYRAVSIAARGVPAAMRASSAVTRGVNVDSGWAGRSGCGGVAWLFGSSAARRSAILARAWGVGSGSISVKVRDVGDSWLVEEVSHTGEGVVRVLNQRHGSGGVWSGIEVSQVAW